MPSQVRWNNKVYTISSIYIIIIKISSKYFYSSCNSDDLKSKLVPVQNSSTNTCQMKLEKFSPELEGVWRGETWPEEGRVELVMQQDVSRLEV